jgi:SWI/SNF-related matrix-associated actin-dependent regulator 1 of chromatin subfamily A
LFNGNLKKLIYNNIFKFKGVQYIRIDGSTNPRDRQTYCDQFQTDTKTKAAVLSITAAGTGITLTAASIVIFAELYWNPSVLGILSQINLR